MTIERKCNRSKKKDRQASKVNRGNLQLVEDEKNSRQRKHKELEPLQAKNERQKEAFRLLDSKQLTVLAGSAGSGKTMLASYFASKEWLKGNAENIIITRPNKSMNGDNAAIPGSDFLKTLPYTMAILSKLKMFLGAGVLKNNLRQEMQDVLFNDVSGIQVYSMEKLNGLSFDDKTIIIADECFEEGAEILTPKGFKDFKDIKEGDLVAQYTEEGILEFVKPLRIISKGYKGKMHQVEKDRFKWSVTPNHRCVTESTSGKTVFVEEAKDLKKSGRFIPRTAVKEGGELDGWWKLAIALQADGNSNYKKSRNTYSWQASFKKLRKIERFESILKDLGLRYSKYPPCDRGLTRFYLGDLSKTKIVEILSFDKKEFNLEEVLKLSTKSLSEFREETILWDGHTDKKGVELYCTTNKHNAEVAQIVGHLSGCVSEIRKTVDKRKDSYKDYYKVIFQKTHRTGISNATSKKKDYNGKVYCVEVPSGMIMVKQFGRVFISGNCQSSTVGQMKSLLTRLESGSRMVVCGDPLQSAIRGDNGLDFLLRTLDKNPHKDIGVVKFLPEDCCRTGVSAHFTEIFERQGKWSEGESNK